MKVALVVASACLGLAACTPAQIGSAIHASQPTVYRCLTVPDRLGRQFPVTTDRPSGLVQCSVTTERSTP